MQVKPGYKFVLSLAMMLIASTLFAQDQKEDQTEEQQAEPFVQQYSDAEWVEYEFGVRVECSGGYALTTTVNAPIPIEWPDQELELYEETKSNNIKKNIITKPLKGTGNASYMAFGVPRLNNGDYAEGILRYRVKRKNTIRPEDTDQFEFAEKLKGKMKAYLKPSPFIDSRSKQIRGIGEEILAETKDLPAWDQVEAIYSWVRENVRYKFDKLPHTCAEALESGHGDCEELSALFIAICRSRGIPARAVWVPGHTYPEFYLADATGQGHWFPCQAAGQNHEFGEMNEARPILQKGDRFRTPVGKEWKRYVEVALSAKDATGALKVEHVMRKVGDE